VPPASELFDKLWPELKLTAEQERLLAEACATPVHAIALGVQYGPSRVLRGYLNCVALGAACAEAAGAEGEEADVCHVVEG